MAAVVAFSAAALFGLHLRKVERGFRTQGILAGCIWLMMNLTFDWPMFSFGPMQMSPLAYLGDIGAAYLAIPAICIPIGVLLESKLA